MPAGKTLRLILADQAALIWSDDNWTKTSTVEATRNNALDLWSADLPTGKLGGTSVIEFTFFWKSTQRWEGRNYSVTVVNPGRL